MAKIKISRLLNPEGLDYIFPLYPEDLDMDTRMVKDLTAEGLIKHPDNVLILVAYDEDDNIYAVLHALAAFNVKHTFIYFLWISPKLAGTDTGKKIKQRLALQIEEWTFNLGRTVIKAETQRNPEAMLRAFGFKQVSVTLEKRLDIPEQKSDDEFELPEEVKETTKESSDEQQTIDKTSTDILRGKAGSEDLQSDQEQGGRQREGVSGGDSSTPESDADGVAEHATELQSNGSDSDKQSTD